MHPFGTIGLYSNSGGVSPPSNGWLTPPVMTDTTMNGLTDACGLFCNVLDIGDRNYFSCIASGNYTVSVYTSVGGTLISSQNIVSNVQCNWQIDWATCTKSIDANTRQAYVEITPQAGQSLALLRLNTNHPAETNANSSPNFVAAYGALPTLTNATNMFTYCYALQAVTLAALSALSNATSMFASCIALQAVTLPTLPALTNATNMFAYCYALQAVTLPTLPALTNTTNMFVSCIALQAVTLPTLPALTNATSMFASCYALQAITLTALSALTNATSMFGSTVETACARSIRKITNSGLGTAFASATTFILRYTAIQEPEALAWVSSLGTSANTITFDLRNNPFSTSALVVPAILAKFPNSVVTLV
jgi:hypothetical protein